MGVVSIEGESDLSDDENIASMAAAIKASPNSPDAGETTVVNPYLVHIRDLLLEATDSLQLPPNPLVLVGEGMPLSKSPNAKGDLKIKFDIRFPKELSGTQREALRGALADAAY
jgi:DnaJ family protein B protein 4